LIIPALNNCLLHKKETNIPLNENNNIVHRKIAFWYKVSINRLKLL